MRLIFQKINSKETFARGSKVEGFFLPLRREGWGGGEIDRHYVNLSPSPQLPPTREG